MHKIYICNIHHSKIVMFQVCTQVFLIIGVGLSQPPLIVDLDGTLIHTDMLHESALRVFRDCPLEILRIPFLLAKGKALLNPCLTPPKKYLNRSTTCGASVFIAVDLFIISSQTISFLVLPGVTSMPSVW